MRELFITDIHSQFTKFKQLLESVNYDDQADLLVLGGDYFDRGPESYEMARWLEDNFDKPNVVLLRGNHDLSLISLLEDDQSIKAYLDIKFMIKHNGLDATLKGLVGHNYYNMNYKEIRESINRMYPKLLRALHSTRFYHETSSAIYTHAKLPERYVSRAKKDWERTVWADSVDWANSMSWRVRRDVSKPVVIGHWSLSNFDNWDGESYIDINGVRFCDGAMGWSGQGIVHIVDPSEK